jgi:hypothetical protein
VVSALDFERILSTPIVGFVSTSSRFLNAHLNSARSAFRRAFAASGVAESFSSIRATCFGVRSATGLFALVLQISSKWNRRCPRVTASRRLNVSLAVYRVTSQRNEPVGASRPGASIGLPASAA